MSPNQNRVVVDKSGNFVGEIVANVSVGDILKLGADSDGELLYWMVIDLSDTKITVSEW